MWWFSVNSQVKSEPLVSVASCNPPFTALMSYDQHYLIPSDKRLRTDEAHVQLMYIKTVKPAGLIINLWNAGMQWRMSLTARTRRVGAPSSYWTVIKLSKNSGATLHRGCAKYTRDRTLKEHDTVSKQLIRLWMQPSHMQPTLTSSSVCTIKANLLMFHTLQRSSNQARET